MYGPMKVGPEKGLGKTSLFFVSRMPLEKFALS